MSDIDDRVAKEVMGWRKGTRDVLSVWEDASGLWRAEAKDYGSGAYWQPSKNMNHAMMVVETMRVRGYWVDMTDWSKNWEASFYARGKDRKWASSSCDTLPEAICEAALAAVESK